jgi:hypothetical protein
MLGKVFEKFIAKAPVAVMVRGVLERVLNPDALNDIYARAAVRQYTRDLLFSSVVAVKVGRAGRQKQPSQSQ